MTCSIQTLNVARELRQRMTQAEKILWNVLRAKNIGFKFRRQAPFVFSDDCHYIADFYCPEKKLIIELDGGIHNNKFAKEYDKFREDIFKISGYKILRFKNKEVIESLNKVIVEIKKKILSKDDIKC